MRLDCLAPFSLRNAQTLPVTGDLHPLRREFHKWMSLGNAATMLVALLATSTLLSMEREPAAPKKYFRFRTCGGLGDLHRPQPDVVVRPRGSGGSTPKEGIIEPRPDLGDFEFPTVDQIPGALDAEKVLGDVGEISVGEGPTPSLPGPDVFVAREVEPELLRMETPVYPPLAREVGVEGTVLLRVLVSKDGKVLNCIVLSGNPILTEAALVAARTALFSPARQQEKPVAVWVQLPIVFSLN